MALPLLFWPRGPEAQSGFFTWDCGWLMAINSISHLSSLPHYWVVAGLSWWVLPCCCEAGLLEEGARRWAAHKERAAQEPSADGESVDSRGLFSGGHLHGQLLILKGRSWHSPKSAIDFDCTRKFHLPRPVSTGWRARLFLPPTHPPVADEVLHQRTSISCGLGHVQLAVAADACPLRT